MKNLIKKVLKEESLRNKLLDDVKEYGWKEVSDYVGGSENLLNILGKSNETVMLYLMGHFDDLKVNNYGRVDELLQNSIDLMRRTHSEYYNSNIEVYDDYIRYVLSDVPKSVYIKYRRDIIRELISTSEKFSSSEDVILYNDRSLSKVIDKFKV
jgi:hypothetical protein